MPRVSLKPEQLKELVNIVELDLEDVPNEEVERKNLLADTLKVLKIAVVRNG